MSTLIRPELTKSNSFYISKHRYYELKHFCLQYDEWKALIRKEEESIHGAKVQLGNAPVENSGFSDPSADQAIKIATIKENCELIDGIIGSMDPVLGRYLFLAITKDLSYTTLKTKYDIPCGKDLYYKVYHRFFWILSRAR